jgi:MFS family permease
LTSYYSNRIYDSVGIDDDNTRFGLNGGRSILDLIVTVSFAMLIDRVGRRPLFLTATAGMLVFFMCMTILGWKYSQDPSQGVGIGFVVFQWMHGVSYALAWSGLLVAYAVEVLPYKLRAKGLMIMNMSVQAALALNGQVNPIPMDGAWKGSEWKLYTVYTCWIALELVVIYFLYVETRYVLPIPLNSKPKINPKQEQSLT